MATTVENCDNTPQWKKDLIARLRSQNKKGQGTQQQQLSSSGHRTNTTSTAGCAVAVCGTTTTSAAAVIGSTTLNAVVTGDGTGGSAICRRRGGDVVSGGSGRDMVVHRPDQRCQRVVAQSVNGYNKDGPTGDSDDSSEELRYGPGIVNRLKNKYLSLALRESAGRPSLARMRKAASLEDMLDDVGCEDEEGEGAERGRRFERKSGGVPGAGSRYRPASRRVLVEMKRARSVETISRISDDRPPSVNRQSLHEDVFLNHPEVLDVLDMFKAVPTERPPEPPVVSRVNRPPRRLQPLVDEREKPPPDFVRHAKMIFERRPEQRTRKPPQTGEVAAKVEGFNSIIVKAKVASKKPPIKHSKPALNEKSKNNAPYTRPVAKPVIISEEIMRTVEITKKPKTLDLKESSKYENSLPSPIPDVSRVDRKKGEGSQNSGSSLSETPDLILTSSPINNIASPTFKSKSTESFLKEERKNTSPTKIKTAFFKHDERTEEIDGKENIMSPTMMTNGDGRYIKQNGSTVFNFTKVVNKNISEARTPPSLPLKIEVNGTNSDRKVVSPGHSPKILQKALTPTEIEKNYINSFATAKNGGITVYEDSFTSDNDSLTVTSDALTFKNGAVTIRDESVTVRKVAFSNKDDSLTVKNVTVAVKDESVTVQNCSITVSEVVNKSLVAGKKPKRQRGEASNEIVFNFTDRKDVPDYIANDRSRSPSKPELPKPGEGGIILIPGATLADSFTDEDEEEILKSLERPPSPCDVTFVNDNVLIDGKSSMVSRQTKRTKLKISFVDEGPDVYEYPSENSLLLEDSPVSPAAGVTAQVGHTVPTLTGSSLATYTPKTTDEFQLGVTRSPSSPPPNLATPQQTEETPNDLVLEEVHSPVAFSTGNSADILF